jgi:hypothetical protein
MYEITMDSQPPTNLLLPYNIIEFQKSHSLNVATP